MKNLRLSNFGPIDDIDINIRPITILVGNTICK